MDLNSQNKSKNLLTFFEKVIFTEYLRLFISSQIHLFQNQFYLQVKILFVEDDSQIASFVKLGLESNQFFVDVAYDGVMGEKLALQKKYDVIVLGCNTSRCKWIPVMPDIEEQ